MNLKYMKVSLFEMLQEKKIHHINFFLDVPVEVEPLEQTSKLRMVSIADKGGALGKIIFFLRVKSRICKNLKKWLLGMLYITFSCLNEANAPSK